MARTKKSEELKTVTGSELPDDLQIPQTDLETDQTPQTDPEPDQAPQTDLELFPEEPWTESPSEEPPPDSQTELEMAGELEDGSELQREYPDEPAFPETDLDSYLEPGDTADPIAEQDMEPALSQTDSETPLRARMTRSRAEAGQSQQLRMPGRRGPKVISIDGERTVETDADRRRSDLLDLVESLKSGKILTGTVQGVERMKFDPEKVAAVVYHGDYKILIPAQDMIEEPSDYRGRPKSEVLYYLLQKRMGAEVDYIVKILDQQTGIISASRLEAMARKRKEYYFRTDRDGNYQIYAGIRAEARVVSVIRAGIFVDLFGAECYIPVRELSYQRWVDAGTHFQPGQRVLVKVLEVDRADRSNLQVTASVKQAGENPYEKALQKYDVGNRYVGTVSLVDTTGVFVSLDGGIDCLCTYPKRGRPPRGCRVTVRILGINHESNRIWGVITHMSTAR